MAFLVGTDEAGYGPNLGPLVVAISVWEVPSAEPVDLYELLAPVVTGSRPRFAARRSTPAPLWLADSKQVYTAAHGASELERGVLALLALQGALPADWSALWNRLVPGLPSDLDGAPWHQNVTGSIPWAVAVEDVRAAGLRLQQHLVERRISLVATRARVLFPRQFNEQVNDLGTKSAVLTRLTLDLLCTTLAALPAGPVWAVCDKHGARNGYAPALQAAHTAADRAKASDAADWIEVCEERAERSVYRWGASERRVEVEFRPRAEAWLPTAVASMTAKYLRETALQPFNAFWQARVPGLRATAGYPLDARRFRREIAESQTALGLDDTDLWRNR